MRTTRTIGSTREGPMKLVRMVSLGVALAAGMLATGCGESSGPSTVSVADTNEGGESLPPGVEVADEVMSVEGIDRVPSSTLQDAAGFADAAVIVTVEREQ